MFKFQDLVTLQRLGAVNDVDKLGWSDSPLDSETACFDPRYSHFLTLGGGKVAARNQ